MHIPLSPSDFVRSSSENSNNNNNFVLLRLQIDLYIGFLNVYITYDFYSLQYDIRSRISHNRNQKKTS